MSTEIVIGAAWGIMSTLNKTRFKEYGGHLDLNRYWALSLLHHMNFVPRKAITAKSNYSVENFAEKKRIFRWFSRYSTDGGYTTRIGLQVGPDWNQADTIDIMDGEWARSTQSQFGGFERKVTDNSRILWKSCRCILPIQLIYRVKQMTLSKIWFPLK